jgi:DNA-binding MarR family transcriptional regulator
MTRPKSPKRPKRKRRLDLEATLEVFETFQHRLAAAHEADFTAIDLTMAQAKLLYVVTSGGSLTMSDVAARLGISVSTASGAVDHLVQLGLLARVEDPTNRRQVLVSVTPLGTQTLEQMRDLGSRHMTILLADLSREDLATVDRAIRILTAAMPAPPDTTRNPE